MTHPLRLLRTTLGLTQLELAESIGVTHGRVSQIECGYGGNLGGPSLLLLAELYRTPMARLGITIEDVLRGKRAA